MIKGFLVPASPLQAPTPHPSPSGTPQDEGRDRLTHSLLGQAGLAAQTAGCLTAWPNSLAPPCQLPWAEQQSHLLEILLGAAATRKPLQGQVRTTPSELSQSP